MKRRPRKITELLNGPANDGEEEGSQLDLLGLQSKQTETTAWTVSLKGKKV